MKLNEFHKDAAEQQRPDQMLLMFLEMGASLKTLATRNEPAIFSVLRIHLCDTQNESLKAIKTLLEWITASPESAEKTAVNTVGENVAQFVLKEVDVVSKRDALLNVLKNNGIRPPCRSGSGEKRNAAVLLNNNRIQLSDGNGAERRQEIALSQHSGMRQRLPGGVERQDMTAISNNNLIQPPSDNERWDCQTTGGRNLL